jgi:transcriptional regulator with GAF, ATPase, and Fis domain
VGLSLGGRNVDVTHESALAAAFVELAEAMVSGRSLDDFLHLLSCRTIELLDADAAGVMLADENDRLRAIAASNEDTHLLEVFALQHEEGVCLDVYRTGKPEQVSTAGTTDRWPHFSQRMLQNGYGWVCGIPLRHGDEIIGALNLFREKDEPLGEPDVRLGQALADVATVALLQQRETMKARRQATQLQAALDSRVVIEQAKGVLSERLDVTLDEAFQVLRKHARDNNRKLSDLANEIAHGDADVVRQFRTA